MPAFARKVVKAPRLNYSQTHGSHSPQGRTVSAVLGFWLLLGSEELLVPFAEFPWFRKATIEQISAVEWPSENHLYWPQLDVDLSVESIRQPADFPLMSRVAG